MSDLLFIVTIKKEEVRNQLKKKKEKLRRKKRSTLNVYSILV